MKQRVVSTLSAIAEKGIKNTTGMLLMQELGVSEQELKNRAAVVLKQILHNYSELSIGTIDSFTHKIVRTFAHDLKLPVNFSIELDTGAFYEKVIASLFASVGEDDYVSKLLKEYVLQKARENEAWDPQATIQQFVALLQKEDTLSYVEKLNMLSVEELDEIRLQFIDFIADYKKHLKEHAGAAISLIEKNNISMDLFFKKEKGPVNFFYKCFNNTVVLEDIEKPELNKIITRAQWEAKPGDPAAIEISAINDQLTQIAQTLCDYIRQHDRYYQLSKKLLQQMYPLMLLKKIEELTLQQKQEERLVFLSEFNEKIFELIQNEPTPFIYERLGEKYQNYLLDEFQDTSSLQWQNLLPLIDNSLANGWFNLVVGDGKQSIYRWRNANVKQFAELPAISNDTKNEVIAERAQNLNRNYEEKKLTANFRSAKDIVNFNNNLFSKLALEYLNEQQSTIYQHLEQTVVSDQQGYVSLHLGNTSTSELDLKTLGLVRLQIEDALAAGFRHNDICVLSRNNKKSFMVADYLVQENIPVVSSDSLALINSKEVAVVVNYLRYLADANDTLSAAAVLEHLFAEKNTPSQQKHALRRLLSQGRRLSLCLEEIGISINDQHLRLLNVFDAAVTIIAHLGLDANGYQYLRFFMDEVAGYLQTQTAGLSDFLEWWEYRKKKASLVIPESTDAVRVMTMHASKGLEFPVVIIPYCNWMILRDGEQWVTIRSDKTRLPVSLMKLSGSSSKLGFEQEYEQEKAEQLLDNMNILYVAFTRAVKRLHIIGYKSEGQKRETVADWLLNYAQTHLTLNNDNFYEYGNKLGATNELHAVLVNNYLLAPTKFNGQPKSVTIKSAAKLSSPETTAARDQGILIHWLFSLIATSADLTKALDKAIQCGEISLQEHLELSQKISRIMALPLLAESFSSPQEVFLERELVTPNAAVIRPDRFTVHGDHCFLIDFKTGKEDLKKHQQQLINYQQCLNALGYTNIYKYLVYTNEEQVLTVN